MITNNGPDTDTSGGARDVIIAAVTALGTATARQVADHTRLGYSTVTAGLRKLAAAGQVNKVSAEGTTTWRPAGHASPDPTSGATNTIEERPGPTSDDPGNAASQHQAATVPADPPAPSPVASPSTGPAAGPGHRRGKGQLRAQVLGVLQDRPDEALTPHAISKQLNGASPGAIVLAARKLVHEGSLKQVRVHPATFQAN